MAEPELPTRAGFQVSFKFDRDVFIGERVVAHNIPWAMLGCVRRLAVVVVCNPRAQIVGTSNVFLGWFNCRFENVHVSAWPVRYSIVWPSFAEPSAFAEPTADKTAGSLRQGSRTRVAVSVAGSPAVAQPPWRMSEGWCECRESNPDQWLRRPLHYPLCYIRSSKRS